MRLGVGAGILVVLVGHLGARPFLGGLRLTSMWSLAAALAITALTTVCCAWRWRLTADGLGVHLPPRKAVAAYYRSQFLNATLPGGVLGDVHRAVRHGRDVGEMGRSLRSVAWERSLGQVVQVALTVVVVLVLPSPMRSPVLVIAATGGVALLVVGLVMRGLTGGSSGLPARVARTLADDLSHILLNRRWVGIVLASAVAAAGHAVIFLIAVRATGATVSTGRLLPLAFVVVLASTVPMNVAGWGPREGASAWVFSSVGLSAAQGVTAAVVYGVMALVAALPGAVVLVAGRRRRDARSRKAPRPAPRRLEDAVDV